MNDTQSAGKPDYGRRIRWLGIGVVIVVALYTAGWFYLAHVIETRTTAALAQVSTGGVSAQCANPTARGYPFRIGLFCDRVAYDDPAQGIDVSAGAFRSAGQVYDPMHLVVELDGPAAFSAPGVEKIAADWKKLRASVRLGTPLPRRISIEGGGLAARTAAGAALVSADSFEGHMRPNGDDVDLAGRFSGMALDKALAGGHLLPPLSGEADLTVKNGTALLLGGDKSLRNRAATIRTLTVSLGGGGSLSVTGPLAVDADGLVDADLQLAIKDPQALSAALAAAFPEKQAQIEQAFSGLAALGSQSSFPVRIVKGKASFGFIKLGSIPPLE